MRYREPVTAGQLNLLDSHDVGRFLSLCRGDLRRMRLAVLFQMTFVGMPCVFYGDELGMEGVSEEEYRRPMPWDQTGHPLRAFYRRAIALRSAEPVLRAGRFICEQADGGLYRYRRDDGINAVTVVMNLSLDRRQIRADREILWQSGWNDGILDAYGFVVMKR